MLRLIFKQYFITLTLNNVIQIIFKYPKPIKNYRIVIIIYMINKNNTAKPYINYYYRGLNIIRVYYIKNIKILDIIPITIIVRCINK